MKIFQKLVCSLAFILAFTIFAVAQTEKPHSVIPKKVGIIDSGTFEDKEKGIKELIDAYNNLDTEFKTLN